MIEVILILLPAVLGIFVGIIIGKLEMLSVLKMYQKGWLQ